MVVIPKPANFDYLKFTVLKFKDEHGFDVRLYRVIDAQDYTNEIVIAWNVDARPNYLRYEQHDTPCVDIYFSTVEEAEKEFARDHSPQIFAAVACM